MTPAQQQQHDYLLTQLRLLIRSDGNGGLTSAEDLRAFEELLVDQLFADPSVSFDSGPADPTAAQGNEGDFWLNETSGWLWRKYDPATAPGTGGWIKRTLLRGADSQVAGPQGIQGLQGIPGGAGKSAYQLAVDNGYSGTLTQWLLGLKGADGASAYQLAVAAGYQGTAQQWLASLKGADSQVPGPQGIPGLQGKTGGPGPKGADGASAYQLAVAAGYSGSAAQWLASLQGKDGQTPPRLRPPITAAPSPTDGATGDQVLNIATGDYYEKTDPTTWTLRGNLKGPKGDPGAAGTSTTTTTSPGTTVTNPYTLPQATASTLGGVKSAGAGLAGNVVVNGDGSLTAPGGTGTGTAGPTTTDGLAEGTTNLYFTPARVLATTLTGYAKATSRAALSASTRLLDWLQQLEFRLDAKQDRDTYAGQDYAASLTLDFATESVTLLSLAGSLSIGGTQNRTQGKSKRVFITNSSSAAATLSFPAAWRFLGAVPTTLPAGKSAYLSLECVMGGNESDIVAGYNAQA